MQILFVRSAHEWRGVRGNAIRSKALYRKEALCRFRRHALYASGTRCSVGYPTIADWKNDFNERFVLEKAIGRGSFGEVWLAIDKQTREKVAVKEMPKKRGRLTAEGTFAKVDREISVMEDLKSCPATVQLKECHALPNSYRIVMEYCAGCDLREQIKRFGPTTEEVVAYVAFEILHILKKCHANRIVHGDVKTANFILRSIEENPFVTGDVRSLKKGWLKAIDFGCSQYVPDGERMTSRVGTPVFMAPEVFDRDYSFESDLWSLGVVLYQLVSGRFPFWDSTQSALTSSVQDVMETIHLADPDFENAPFDVLSKECLDFMQRLLDKNYLTRMDVHTALKHPFIRKNVKSDEKEMSSNNIVKWDIENGDSIKRDIDYAVLCEAL